jgi:DNA-binding MarR family transcriptional regulator
MEKHERLEGVEEPAGASTEEDTPAALWTMLCDLVLDNERRREVAEALGMSFGRVRALRRIAARAMPMGELAATLGIDAPYTTIVVDDLQRQGLVERRPHPTDRRAKVVVATRRGRVAAQRANEILGTPPAGLAGLDQADVRELARIVRSVTEVQRRLVPADERRAGGSVTGSRPRA